MVNVIIEGIKQFGLAPDGSDLRDLAAAIERLTRERDEARDYAVKLRIEHQTEADKLRGLWDADAAQLAKAQQERDNLQARLTARAKSMLRLRNVLAEVHDNIEDEGDRAYFGSTNDADSLRKVWRDLDEWNWDDIMADGKLPDVYATSREAHARAETLSAQLAKAREALTTIAEAMSPP